MLLGEESLILLTLKPGEIPRGVYPDTGGARNDTKKEFFSSLLVDGTDFLVQNEWLRDTQQNQKKKGDPACLFRGKEGSPPKFT